MKLIPIGTLFVIFLLAGSLNCDKDEGDSDFAEFEDFDDAEDDFVKAPSAQNEPKGRNADRSNIGSGKSSGFKSDDGEDGVVEDENEFDHFTDEEEFEGFNKESSSPPTFDQNTGEPKLTVAKVPLHFRYELNTLRYFLY